MTNIEKIRQEIERLKGVCMVQIKSNPGQTFPFIMEMTGHDKLLSFIDSLPEEKPSEDLEEEVFKEWGTTKEEYLTKSMDKVHLEMEIATYLQDWDDDDEIGLHLSTDNGSIPIELEDIRNLARHFAEWGAKHLK